MRGVVLAAGPGRRLEALTETLPKTLLPLDDGRTILDLAMANLRSVGVEEVVVVTGFAAERVEERVADLERRHRVRIELLFNERASEWNNAYSLWLARDALRDGALLVNGDTVHPPSVEESLLAAPDADLVLALDDAKPLGDEAMKVGLDDVGRVARIHKSLDAADAAGEYIGVALIAGRAVDPLAEALEATWRADPTRYYEDGFEEFARRGGLVGVASIGAVEWVEVDERADLERAREIACRS